MNGTRNLKCSTPQVRIPYAAAIPSFALVLTFARGSFNLTAS